MNNTITQLASVILFATSAACAGSRASAPTIAQVPAAVRTADFERCTSFKATATLDTDMVEVAMDAASRGSDECAGLAQRVLLQNLKQLQDASTLSETELAHVKSIYVRAHSMWGTRALLRAIEQLDAQLALRDQPIYAAQ
jgi:hypothetical protein